MTSSDESRFGKLMEQIDALELAIAMGDWARLQLRAGRSREQVAEAITASADDIAQEVLDGEHD